MTNPPLDAIREELVTSLNGTIGPEANLLEPTPASCRQVVLPFPVISNDDLAKIRHINRDGDMPGFITHVSRGLYDVEGGGAAMAARIDEICAEVSAAIADGARIIVLSDRHSTADLAPIPSLLLTAAVHHHLVREKTRTQVGLLIEAGDVREVHHVALLVGYGAAAVNPYLAMESVEDLAREGYYVKADPDVAVKNLVKALGKGVLKVMSKMGVSTVASYTGAQIFEAVGLSQTLVDRYFTGTTSKLGGIELDVIAEEVAMRHRTAYPRGGISPAHRELTIGGEYQWRREGEPHLFDPETVFRLQHSTRAGRYDVFKQYTSRVDEQSERLMTLRGLFRFKDAGSTGRQPIPIEEVEPVSEIVKRFSTGAMSYGSISQEAHETLAIAMNRLGGKSNTGEGGEDPERLYDPERRSSIKQVASGRFGVTSEYLTNSDDIQIKMAQGAKPGEGGQLPGGKVNALIARLRHSVPGVTLISPPPHHDIYSIEDLAQLIFDLKQVNPDAQVSVKLVSEPGVGTVASGVAKAYADLITISGYDGGTAASPLTSIRYAGSPWELGLAEAHQALRGNDLRDKIRLQTDGGLKTGLDVIKAAILGAESFGFGTVPMIVLGCKYLRICHLNNCATGVATQRDDLRKEHFIGAPELLINYFTFVAKEVRELLALLGVKSIPELIGRTDLLKVLEGETVRQGKLDLTPILRNDLVPADKPTHCQVSRNEPFDKALLNQKMVEDMLTAIDSKSGGSFHYEITNCDRSVGARVSGEIAKRHGNLDMETAPIKVRFTGTAGQSFGVFNAGGLHMYIEGDANDYVGKGMAGGKLVIRPPNGSPFKSQETAIIGNTCLYGATGGKLLAAGTAGERFGVRNSGAHAVVEGAGDHCCEYMTGGSITVLGRTGHNFGAGMTGGFAFVLDEDNDFFDRINPELIELHRISSEATESHRSHLRGVISDYVQETGSEWGQYILDNFDAMSRKFWLVKPKAASLENLLKSTRANPA